MRRTTVVRQKRIFSVVRPRRMLTNEFFDSHFVTPNIPERELITRNTSETKTKVSYCTTCFNRFWQLRQVVKHNLSVINSDQNAEWIVVDFGGRDSAEIEAWLAENCPKSLANGTLKYYKRTAAQPFVWNVAVAKNVAHRFATGDILVNLDGDNFLQKSDPAVVRQLFTQHGDTVLHQTWNNILIYNTMRSLNKNKHITYTPFLEHYTGSYGRISISRDSFMRLGGYDEEMTFMGYQDTDLLARSVLSGLHYISKPPSPNRQATQSRPMTMTRRLVRSRMDLSGSNAGSRIATIHGPHKSSHTGEVIGNERTKPYSNNTVKSWRQAEEHNRQLSFRKIRAGRLLVNQAGFHESLDHYKQPFI
jgi:glycosyltransferase involved in cell wall biosynthesis